MVSLNELPETTLESFSRNLQNIPKQEKLLKLQIFDLKNFTFPPKMKKSRYQNPPSNPSQSVISQQLTRFMKLTSPSPNVPQSLPMRPGPKPAIYIDNNSTTEDELPRNSIPRPLAQESMGLAGIRAKMQNLKLLEKKKGKTLEIRVLIEDLRLRLIQKGFFEYLKEKCRMKKAKSGKLRLFLKSRAQSQTRSLFLVLKAHQFRKAQLSDLHRELNFRNSEKTLRKVWLKLHAYCRKRKEVYLKKSVIEETALKSGLSSVLMKLKDRCGFLKKIRAFEDNVKSRRKQVLFNALKKNRASLTEVKEFLSKHSCFPSDFSIKARVRRGFHREVSKLRNSQKNLKTQVKTLRKPLKLGSLAGKFNAEEIRRMIDGKVAENIKKKAFLAIKFAVWEGRKSGIARMFKEIRGDRKSVV